MIDLFLGFFIICFNTYSIVIDVVKIFEFSEIDSHLFYDFHRLFKNIEDFFDILMSLIMKINMRKFVAYLKVLCAKPFFEKMYREIHVLPDKCPMLIHPTYKITSRFIALLSFFKRLLKGSCESTLRESV